MATKHCGNRNFRPEGSFIKKVFAYLMVIKKKY